MRKGQAALEFMLTYGWTFFIITGIVATLAYFGVFDVSQFLVEKCVFSSGVVCVDHVIAQAGVTVVIQNAMGVNIENVSLIIEECSGAPIVLAQLDSGSQTTFVDSCALVVEESFKSKMIFNYTNPDSGLMHAKRGELAGNVQ